MNTNDNEGGIYKIINKIDGKYYIGRTNHFHRRWRQHCNELNRGNHHNQHLQKAWNKYGQNNFEFVITDNIIDQKSQIFAEQQHINRFIEDRKNGVDNCYNFSESSNGPMLFGNKNGMYGKKHSDDTKKKISKINKGRVFSDETKRLWSEQRKGRKSWWTGKKMSAEHCEKLSKLRIGKKHSAKTKEKISLSQKGEKNHNWGKKISKEQHIKMLSKIIDGTIYKWRNESLSLTENLTRLEMQKKYQLISSNVCDLVAGKRKSHKGWTFVGVIN
jgi:group I intron endonuclease